MWYIGKASEKEISAIEDKGYEVQEVDIRHFDLSLGADENVDYLYEYDNGDKLIAVYVDCDISEICSGD